MLLGASYLLAGAPGVHVRLQHELLVGLQMRETTYELVRRIRNKALVKLDNLIVDGVPVNRDDAPTVQALAHVLVAIQEMVAKS